MTNAELARRIASAGGGSSRDTGRFGNSAAT